MREAIPGSSEYSIFEKWDPEFGINVVRITITSKSSFSFAEKIRDALHHMSHIDFVYDFVDIGPKEQSFRPTNFIKPGCGKTKIVEAIDLLIYSLNEFDCKYKSGEKYFLYINKASIHCM